MTAFWIQFAVSFAAIGLMIALAAWARIARPQPVLTSEQARMLIVLDFPTAEPRPIWIADDGHGAIARNGDQALLLFAVGDSYVTRSVAWRALSDAVPKAGRVRLNLHEFEAPMAQFAVSGTAMLRTHFPAKLLRCPGKRLPAFRQSYSGGLLYPIDVENNSVHNHSYLISTLRPR